MSKVAVVFPGQGSQRPGMGQDFHDTYTECAALFDQASSAIDVDIRELCFTENDKVNLTQFTQPSILTVGVAVYEALKNHHNFKPELFGGHSLGEYSALVAAGVIPFESAIKIVHERGKLMQGAVPEGVGAMTAIIGDGLSQSDCEALVEQAGAEVVNFNSREQIVISGKKEDVIASEELVAAKYPEFKLRRLTVSAPFHSSLMKVIEGDFRSVLEKYSSEFNLEKAAQVVSNFTGEFHQPDKLIDNLVYQLSGSVAWNKNMMVLNDAADAIYEVGPNRVLAKFFGTMDVDVKSIINLRGIKKAFKAA